MYSMVLMKLDVKMDDNLLSLCQEIKRITKYNFKFINNDKNFFKKGKKYNNKIM